MPRREGIRQDLEIDVHYFLKELKKDDKKKLLQIIEKDIGELGMKGLKTKVNEDGDLNVELGGGIFGIGGRETLGVHSSVAKVSEARLSKMNRIMNAVTSAANSFGEFQIKRVIVETTLNSFRTGHYPKVSTLVNESAFDRLNQVTKLSIVPVDVFCRFRQGAQRFSVLFCNHNPKKPLLEVMSYRKVGKLAPPNIYVSFYNQHDSLDETIIKAVEGLGA